jgi:hypothetical protein
MHRRLHHAPRHDHRGTKRPLLTAPPDY